MIRANESRPDNIPHNLVHDAVKKGYDAIIIFPSVATGDLHVYFQGNALSQVDLIPQGKAQDFVRELMTFFTHSLNVMGRIRYCYSKKERINGKTIGLSMVIVPKGNSKQFIITIERFEKNGKKNPKKRQKK